MKPRGHQDRRATHAGKAMHQHVAPAQADGDGKHNVFELLGRDRTRIRDGDPDIGNSRGFPGRLFPAKRDDGADAMRIGAYELLCILEIAEIETFTDPGHASNLT